MIYLFSIRGGNFRYIGHYFYSDGRILCYSRRSIYSYNEIMIINEIGSYKVLPIIKDFKYIKPFSTKYNYNLESKHDEYLKCIIEKEILNTIINKL
jgi:hypothetical protein